MTTKVELVANNESKYGTTATLYRFEKGYHPKVARDTKKMLNWFFDEDNISPAVHISSVIAGITIIVFLLTGFFVSLITVIIAGVLIGGIKQASRELIVEEQQKIANLQPRKVLSMLVVRPEHLVSEPQETRFLETGETVSVLEKGTTPIPDIVSVVNRDYSRYLDVIVRQVDSLKQQGIKSSVIYPQACETIRELIDMAEDDINGRTSSPTSNAIAEANDNLRAMTEALRDVRRLNRGDDNPPR